jgi:hypothetical protein
MTNIASTKQASDLAVLDRMLNVADDYATELEAASPATCTETPCITVEALEGFLDGLGATIKCKARGDAVDTDRCARALLERGYSIAERICSAAHVP